MSAYGRETPLNHPLSCERQITQFTVIKDIVVKFARSVKGIIKILILDTAKNSANHSATCAKMWHDVFFFQQETFKDDQKSQDSLATYGI